MTTPVGSSAPDLVDRVRAHLQTLRRVLDETAVEPLTPEQAADHARLREALDALERRVQEILRL
ncbi:MAG: hypothetical protein QN173_10150 [Armatimonadota bacterium]|nr:hypothetical protein [Armatimonadota bacterium]MDR7401527.1 hypothetical protein [Armatimonadota bacterium]MDR7404342.1 hypothetical protein [Armatimonadota bacterium]MDR7437661.1 hypothetical protein [Armatimonadota bacterium]MDR7471665.1 hypothetical protein [Armatimonadota bacterium]